MYIIIYPNIAQHNGALRDKRCLLICSKTSKSQDWVIPMGRLRQLSLLGKPGYLVVSNGIHPIGIEIG